MEAAPERARMRRRRAHARPSWSLSSSARLHGLAVPLSDRHRPARRGRTVERESHGRSRRGGAVHVDTCRRGRSLEERGSGGGAGGEAGTGGREARWSHGCRRRRITGVETAGRGERPYQWTTRCLSRSGCCHSYATERERTLRKREKGGFLEGEKI